MTNPTPHPAAAADLPEALRLADWLDGTRGNWPSYVPQEAAAELRRLHALTASAPAAPTTEQSSEVAQVAFFNWREAVRMQGLLAEAAAKQAAPGEAAILRDVAAWAVSVLEMDAHQTSTAPQAGAESYPPISRFYRSSDVMVASDEGDWVTYGDHQKALRARGAVPSDLQGQHDRDSQELRSLCESRDQARRERDACKAEIAGLEASCATLGRLVDEVRADGERLEWVIRRCGGSWLRAYLGVANDTGDMAELRVLIDANRGAAAHPPAALPGEQDARDAARYRWLMSGFPVSQGARTCRTHIALYQDGTGDTLFQMYAWASQSQINDAIDAAMAAAKGRDAGGGSNG